MPTYEVRRVKPLLTTLILEAASEDEARWLAKVAWLEEAEQGSRCAEVKRQPQRPDDNGDARSQARYEYSEHDALDDQLREERYDAESEGAEA